MPYIKRIAISRNYNPTKFLHENKMKKFTFILSIVTILGVTIVGGSWFAGSQIERQFEEIQPLVNRQLSALKAYGYQVELKNVKLERGFFSSTVKANVLISPQDNPSQKSVLNSNGKLYHGPFPLNQVLKGNFIPAMVGVEAYLTSGDPMVSTLFNQQAVFNADGTVSYSGKWNGKAQLNPLKNPTYALETSAIQISGDSVSPKIKADFVTLGGVRFNKVEYQLPIMTDDKYPAIVGLGKYHASVKSIESEVLSVENIKIEGDTEIKQDRLFGELKINLQPIVTIDGKNEEMGDIRFSIEMDMDADKFNKFAEKSTLSKDDTDPLAVQALEELLANSPKFKAELSIDNSLGKNKLFVDIQSGKLDSSNIRYDLNEWLKLLNNSKADLDLSQSSITQTLKAIYALVPNSDGSAEEQALQVIEEFVTLGKLGGLLQVNGDNVKFDLKIENNQAKLNGKVLSEQELQGFLLLMLAL